MSDQLGTRPVQAAVTDRVMPAVAAPAYSAAPSVAVDVTEAPLRDRVRWGPIVAGVVSALAVLLFLTVLGIALGISALGDDGPSSWGTAAGIWGGLSLLVAFFTGGWMAARSATTIAEGDGALNGLIAGAATLLLLLWMATTAVTGALGFFTSTVADVAGVAPVAIEATDGGALPTASEAESAVGNAIENPGAVVPDEADQAARAAAQAASENAGPGAWGTAIAIVLGIGAAAVGGMLGQNQRLVFPGTRTVVRQG